MLDISASNSPNGKAVSGSPGISSSVLPLEELINEIDEKSDLQDQELLATAELVRQVKLRVEAGEMGAGVRWLEWAPNNFRTCISKLYALNRIASHPNPREALEVFRLQQRERDKAKAQKKTEQKIVDSDPDRKKLIEWARRAKMEKVKTILLAIEWMNSQTKAATKPKRRRKENERTKD